MTVLTPTFNRRALLARLHDDLRAQTCTDFEWVVVDDGSTDGTGDDVRVWTAQPGVSIRYIQQPNSGKHVALNRGVVEARGTYVLIIDSDDRCPAHAVDAFLRVWNSIPAHERAQFATVGALCQSPDGRLLGSAYPADVVDVATMEEHLRVRGAGERCGMTRTAVLRETPFPVFPGERFLAEGMVWNRISARYRSRYVNEVLQTKDFQRGGLTDSIRRVRIENPVGAMTLYRESADLPVGFAHTVRSLINYVRFGLHAGRAPLQLTRDTVRPWLCAAALLPGAAAYLVDRLLLKPSA